MQLDRTAFLNDIAMQLLPACGELAEAKNQAWLLLEHVLGQTKAQLLRSGLLTILPDQQEQLAHLVHERVVNRKPLQYLLGSVLFADLTIAVRPPTLIPRPETEEWVIWLIQALTAYGAQPQRILDLCTGSGCIALALAKAFPDAQVLGVDIAPEAVALAQANALHNNLTNTSFVCADLWQGVPADEQYDLIVANPPYITADEYEQLQPEVQAWEDPGALTAPEQGLAVYKAISQKITKRIFKKNNPGDKCLPVMVLELGTDAVAVQAIFADKGFAKLVLHEDLQGVARWLVGWI